MYRWALCGLVTVAGVSGLEAVEPSRYTEAKPVGVQRQGVGGNVWTWQAHNHLQFGYDSNVLILPEIFTGVSSESAFAQARVGLRGKRTLSTRARLQFDLEAEYQHLADVDNLDATRIMGQTSYQRTAGAWMPHILGSFNYFMLDGEAAMTSSDLAVNVVHIYNSNHVGIVGAHLASRQYDTDDALSATFAAARYGHWLITDPKKPGTRWEADIRVAQNTAEADYESYLSIRPKITWKKRWDQGIAQRKTELKIQSSYDIRTYDGIRDSTFLQEEDSERLYLRAQVRWYWRPQWILGMSSMYTERMSNDIQRDYQRLKFGLELSMAW